ncbi:hypothetical protein OKW30_001375 [Paraburkholderia sp. Clong3]|uniref:hypothetical protein n=1 Tax=Paraburkholderia sp. Clong3 TaxID=2991061 RepID=UPI003D1B5BEE
MIEAQKWVVACLRNKVIDLEATEDHRECASDLEEALELIEQQAANIAALELQVSGERGQKEIWEARAKEWCDKATELESAASAQATVQAAAVEHSDECRAGYVDGCRDAKSKVALVQKPAVWITKEQLAQLEDATSDAWVYWCETGHVAEPDEIPLYTHPAPTAQDGAQRDADDSDLFTLLCEIRAACGDNGERERDELVGFIGEVRRDAERYRAFFDSGLPICFCGVEYRDKASLDAAIDAAIAASAKTGRS